MLNTVLGGGEVPPNAVVPGGRLPEMATVGMPTMMGSSTVPPVGMATMMPTPDQSYNPENLKEKILNTLGGDDPVIMAFSNLSLNEIKETVFGCIRGSLSDKPPEIRKLTLQQINQALQETSMNSRRIKVILDALETAMQRNIITRREVYECLKDLLDTDIESLSFELLRFFDQMITPTDYKISHDIFINCLQEISKLPSVLTGSYHRMFKQITAMLVKLLDRRHLVVPPICCYADIMVAFSKPNVYPHCSLSEMLNKYVATFNSLAEVFKVENTRHFRPIVRHSMYMPSSWKLDPQTLTYNTVNPQFWVLRFQGHYGQPQHDLMLYTLKQNNSKDFVFNVMLGLRHGKQTVYPEIEKIFLKLLRETCRDADAKDTNALQRMMIWERLGGELSHFIFSNAVNIRTFCESVYKEAKQPATMTVMQRHRDFIMWTINRCMNFGLKVIKMKSRELMFIGDLIRLLYPELSPLQVPDLVSPLSTVYFSAAMLWTMFATKTSDTPGIHSPAPPALIEHINFLMRPGHNYSLKDYTASICLNYINNFLINVAGPEGTTNKPIKFLLDSIFVSNMEYYLPGNVAVPKAIHPLPLELLDSLTAHAKMNILIAFSNRMQNYTKMVRPQDMQVLYNHQIQLTPALVETYSRLLSYSETHFLSMKTMINLLSMPVTGPNNFKVAMTILEMCTYRMQYLKNSHHKIQILTNLQNISNISQSSQPPHPQMQYLVESFIVKMILSLDYYDLSELSRTYAPIQITNKVLSSTSEELNKVFILTVARAMVLSRNKTTQQPWLKPYLDTMIGATPGVREWSSFTQAAFPPSVLEFCGGTDLGASGSGSNSAENLAMYVTNEYNRFQQIGAKHDFVKYYLEKDSNCIFLCITLRKYMEMDALPTYAQKVISLWSPAILRKQIRNLIQFVVHSLQGQVGNLGPHNMFNRIANVLDDFIYRYSIFGIDTFVLIACLQRYSEQGSNIAFYLLYILLVKKPALKERVDFFVSRAWPRFWQQNGEHSWSHLHKLYHSKFPEHAAFLQVSNNTVYLPVFYSNICLRFIPVLDILLHRLIEICQRTTIRTLIIEILSTYGRLYAFHDTPVTYLHNTLHYYDNILVGEREVVKKVLVNRILEHQPSKPLKKLPKFAKYVQLVDPSVLQAGAPDRSAFVNFKELLHEFTELMGSRVAANELYSEFSPNDWKYNEFGNPITYHLYLTSIQLMTMPIPPVPEEGASDYRVQLTLKMVDVVLGGKSYLPDLANTLGLILSTLPLSFSNGIFVKVTSILKDQNNFYDMDITDTSCPKIPWNNTAQNVLTIVHSFFQHCKADKAGNLPEFVNSVVKLLVKESQVVYVLKLVSPFLRHVFQDRTHHRHPTIIATLSSLYQAIFNLLAETTVANPNLFVDYMYYNKYIFIGDELKPMIEKHLQYIPVNIAAKLKILAYN